MPPAGVGDHIATSRSPLFRGSSLRRKGDAESGRCTKASILLALAQCSVHSSGIIPLRPALGQLKDIDTAAAVRCTTDSSDINLLFINLVMCTIVECSVIN